MKSISHSNIITAIYKNPAKNCNIANIENETPAIIFPQTLCCNIGNKVVNAGGEMLVDPSCDPIDSKTFHQGEVPL